MSSFGERYYDHFEKFLGRISKRKIFRQDETSPAIQMLQYDHVFEGCRAYCSLGLSHYVDKVGGIFEVFVPADDGWNLVPTVVANSLFFCVQQELSLGRGAHVGGIKNVCPEFVNTFEKTAIYFSNPYALPADFGRLSFDDSKGSVLLGLFISERERTFLKENGVIEFETMLESRRVDPFQLSRRSMV